MDEGDMQIRFKQTLSGMDWAKGVTKQAMLDKLGNDAALYTLVEEYVADETWLSLDRVLDVIPEQAWQDSQGDVWRGGAESEEAGTRASHFKDTMGER